MRLPPLNAIKAFDSVGQLQSVKKAAALLNVTPAAVSHQLKLMEQATGVQLFHRENRSIRLTAAGKRGLEDITAGFEMLERGVRKIQKYKAGNVLVVSAGPAFVVSWLAPRIHDFLQHHPEIDFRVSSNVRYSDFDQDGVDMAIRFGNQPSDGLHTMRLCGEWVVPMCSQEMMRSNPLSPEGMTLIHDDSMDFAQPQPGWADWFVATGHDPALAQHGLRFNQADHALQAAVDNNGIVLGRYVLAMPALLTKRLVIPFGPAIETDFGFHLVSPIPFDQRPAIAAFSAWLNKTFSEHHLSAWKLMPEVVGAGRDSAA